MGARFVQGNDECGVGPSLDALTLRFDVTTRCTTGLSSKVKLPGIIDLTASCGASMVTLPADVRGNKPLVVQRGGGVSPATPWEERCFFLLCTTSDSTSPRAGLRGFHQKSTYPV